MPSQSVDFLPLNDCQTRTNTDRELIKIIYEMIIFIGGFDMGLHGGVVVGIVASQREGSRFNSWLVLSVWS